jgi:hypothetical protein
MRAGRHPGTFFNDDDAAAVSAFAERLCAFPFLR